VFLFSSSSSCSFTSRWAFSITIDIIEQHFDHGHKTASSVED
jgi:hypothetical protein